MNLLFSSDARLRHKINVLDALCYPRGHLLRLRYQEQHVAPEVRAWKVKKGRVSVPFFGGKSLLVFADTSEARTTSKFRFFPTRQGQIVGLWKRGTIYYADVELGRFVNYDFGTPPTLKGAFDEYQRLIGSIKTSPFPRMLADGTRLTTGFARDKAGAVVNLDLADLNQNPGHFFLTTGDELLKVTESREDADDDRAWESTVDALCAFSSLSSSLFYKIDGLYRESRLPWGRRERAIKPVTVAAESQYRLPPGKQVILKMLFYRPDSAPKAAVTGMKVEALGDGFAGVLPSDVRIDSRYNEQRVVVACKRVLDNVIAPILIKKKDAATPTSPAPTPSLGATTSTAVAEETNSGVAVLLSEPFLLAQIRVARLAVFWIIVGLVVGAVLLSIGPDYAKAIGGWAWVGKLSPTFADFLTNRPSDAASLAKVAAGIITVITGILGLRKLPLGK